MEIVVTDLTKFHNKDIVCLAGVNPINYECIRLIPYLQCSFCMGKNILPGAKLTGSFRKVSAGPPHCEDQECHGLVKSGSCTLDEFHSLLEETLSPSLESGFGVGVKTGQKHFERECSPDKSMITIKVKPCSFDIVEDQYNPGRIKGIFEDNQSKEYRFIPITDFCFCEYAEKSQGDYDSITELNSFLKLQDQIFLRIGLTRRYKAPDGRDGFWIQINGIYSFPNIFHGVRACFKK